MLDWRYWLAASRQAHDEIHHDTQTAIAAGLLGGAGEWDCAPKDEVTRQLREIILCADKNYPVAKAQLELLMQSPDFQMGKYP